MRREFIRRTVAKKASWNGLGLHSGVPVQVAVRPGDRGIWFRFGSVNVEAIPENVTATERCTQLGDISTVEHMMSALAGLEITDAEIELTSNELPALDGSSKCYVDGLRESGTSSIGTLSVEGPFARLYIKESDAKVAIGAGEGHWAYHFSSPGRWPETQCVELTLSPEVYAQDIAPARTWGFEEEVEAVLAAGLAKGLDSSSALIIGKAGYTNEARFPDEPARHKLLDLMGDLALSGVPAGLLSVVSKRSGHRLNVLAAKLLRDSVKIERS